MEIKPKSPSMSGRQYSEQAAYVGSHFTEFAELANDISGEHANATPQEGEFDWDCPHYANDFANYGVAVEDMGQHPSKGGDDVDVDTANRGKES